MRSIWKDLKAYETSIQRFLEPVPNTISNLGEALPSGQDLYDISHLNEIYALKESNFQCSNAMG